MIKFDYTKSQYELLCEECMLNEEERLIFKLRCMNNSNTQILMLLAEKNFSMSSATLSRKLKVINNKIHKVIKEGK